MRIRENNVGGTTFASADNLLACRNETIDTNRKMFYPNSPSTPFHDERFN